MTNDDRDDHSEPVAVAMYATEGEAEVAEAKLRAFGIEAALDDQVEGGTIDVEGEPGVIVEVKAADAADAREILVEDKLVDDTVADDDDQALDDGIIASEA